jgi:formate hydrogenlyase transcriptional activator
MDNSQNTTKSSAGSSRWFPANAGTLRQDRSNHKAAGPNFRRLFELAPDAMVLADSPGRIILVNAQTEQLFGYERDELIGERVEMLMPERFRQSYFGHRSAYLMEPRLRPIGAGLELYGLRKDGSEFPIEISLSPLESEVGMLVSTAIRDLSQRKQMEELRTELGFEKLLSELSETFINIPPAVVDGEIENGLRRIVEWYGTDRAALAEVDIATGILIVTHRWDRPGIPPNPERVVKEMFPWLYERILKGEMVCVSRPEQLPEEAGLELEFMNSVGMKSTLNIPLLIGGKLIGALATASFHKHIKWDAALISRFQQVGNVFANALSRKHDDERLQAAYKQISELKERLEQENVYLREEIKLEHDHTAVIGHSDAIRSVLKKAEQVASTDSAVLILGETGTGKELIARTIHELSKRKDHPMVKVNCAAMPATLIESELFGREKGAYTGALSREIGRFELAHHSTIFLDEIGEMPIELQAKLLRVLQDGEFERLGSSKTVHVDVRVIAATNRDLREAVKDGKFREDLFYRLNVFPIQIPPLRERQEDIPALVRHILKNQCKRMGREVESIQPATLKAFEAYSWPGNVRELSNVIERHLILNPGPVFHAEVPESDEVCVPAGQNLEEIERRHMQQVLQNTRWRIRGKGGAAETLGLKPTTLEARMKKLGIVRPQ